MIERPRAGCLRALVFHAMLALILIGHVRVAMDFPRLWAALGINADSMSAWVGGAAGIVIMLPVIFLLLRRMTLERVRQIIDEPRTILKASCADYREMTPSGSEN